MRSKQKIKNESICLHRESNKRPLAFQSGASDHSATLTVGRLCFKLLRNLNILAVNKTNTHGLQYMIEIDMARSVLELTVRQILHFL